MAPILVALPSALLDTVVDFLGVGLAWKTEVSVECRTASAACLALRSARLVFRTFSYDPEDDTEVFQPQWRHLAVADGATMYVLKRIIQERQEHEYLRARFDSATSTMLYMSSREDATRFTVQRVAGSGRGAS